MNNRVINISAKGRYIYLFSRDDDGKSIIDKDRNFHPYFFVEDNYGEYNGIFGEKLKKIVVKYPGMIKEERENYSNSWESDLTYVNRYLIDTFDEIKDSPLRIHYIDIEVAPRKDGKMEQPDVAEAPITSITVYDNFLKKYVIFIWDENEEINIKKEDDKIIYVSDNEDSMIDMFIAFEKKFLPDVMLGWNSGGYDFPYMFNHIGVDKMKEISPLNDAGYSGYGYYIAGISLMDEMIMYKKLTQPSTGKRESYSLNYIGGYEVGLEKIKLKNGVENLKNESFDDRIEYNKRDVEILVKLDKKLDMVNYYNTLRKMFRCTFNDVTMNSRVIDNIIFCYAKDKNIKLPRKPPPVEKEKVVGGYVKQPDRGLYDWVYVLDASSLYPRIIISLNLSPETICKNGEIIVGDIARFDSSKKGILPEILEELLSVRDGIKETMIQLEYDDSEYRTLYMKQYCIKALANSFYGYVAFKGSRFLNPDIANSITYVGRKLLDFSEDYLEDKVSDVVYSDTDGIFIKSSCDNVKGTVEEGMRIQKVLNNSMDAFAKNFNVEKHSFNFKFEKVFKKIFFGGKKRYSALCLWDEGRNVDSIVIKGFEVKRSDTPECVRNFQRGILEKVLRGVDKEKINEFVIDFFNSLKTMDKMKLGFPVGINKEMNGYTNVPIHIRASLFSNKCFEMDIGRGDSIKYFFVKKTKEYNSDIVAIREGYEYILDKFELDYTKIKKRVLMKVGSIYEYLGWKIPAMNKNVGGYTQKSIFFKK